MKHLALVFVLALGLTSCGTCCKKSCSKDEKKCEKSSCEKKDGKVEESNDKK